MALRAACDPLFDALGKADGVSPIGVPGLIVMRSSRPTRPQCILYRPALCLIIQGTKEMVAGRHRATYGEGRSVIITSDMPTLLQITEASPDRPFIGLGLELDPGVMRDVIGSMAAPPAGSKEGGLGPLDEETGAPVRDCVARLIQAAEAPDAVAVLHPLIMREICYWLLTGPNGKRIAGQISLSGSAKRIADVVCFIRQAFAKPIRIEQLAALANMSPSSLHQHFRSVTSTSPLQFQKRLRLAEARRLLLTGGIGVAEAAFQVGYESASQFSREYSRLFGLPPAKDTSFFHYEPGARSMPGRLTPTPRLADGA